MAMTTTGTLLLYVFFFTFLFILYWLYTSYNDDEGYNRRYVVYNNNYNGY